MMRIAIFSDVHGNLSALEAILAEIDRIEIDLLVFAGDLCLVGPRPAACVRLLRDRRVLSVYGNTDNMILARQQPPKRFESLTQWTADQLSATDLRWLSSLPFSVVVRPTPDPKTALQIVHANPKDVDQIIFSPEAEQLSRYGEIRQSDASLIEMLDGLEAQVLAFGHLHLPSIRPWQGHMLLNVSSVSLAGDDDPRAKFALATWNGQEWSAEHVRVDCDVQAEIVAYRSAQPPGWQEAIAALESQGTIPQRV